MTDAALPASNALSTIVAQFSHVDFAVLEKDVEALARWAPMIVRFEPAFAPLIAVIPILEQGLLVADSIKKNWGNPSAVIDSVLPIIRGLADKVQATTPHVAAAAAGQPIPPLPAIDFQAPTGAS